MDACAQWHAEGYKGQLGIIAREDFPVSDAHPRFQPWSPDALAQAQAAYEEDIAAIATLPNVRIIGADKP